MTLGAPSAPLRAPGRVGTAVGASLAGKAAELVTLLLLATVVPRALGPAAYGRFAVALTVVTLASLALTLGGPTVLARYVPAAPPGEQVAVARALGARLARSRLAGLGFLAAAALGLAASRPDLLPPAETALVVTATALNVAATLALQVVLGLGRTGPWSARYAVHNTILVGAVLALHPLAGTTGPVVAIVLAAAGAAALGLWALRPVPGTGGAAVALPAGAVRSGALHAGGAALTQLVHRGPVVAVALLAGTGAEAGHAALAVGISLAATYAVLQAFTVALPHLAAGGGGGGGDGPGHPHPSEPTLRRLAGGLLVALVPVTAALAAGIDTLVVAAFGPGYKGAAQAFGPALALVALAPLHALSVQAAALRDRPGAALASGAVSAAVFATVALAAVPTWGATGGTAAALAGVAAGGVAWLRWLPGAAGTAVAVGSFAGAAAVLAAAVAG